MTTRNKPLDIGFVGLGLMGLPMAMNLLQRHPKTRLHVITGHAKKNLARLRPAARVIRHDRLPELASQVSVCFTMLPTPDDVRRVILGDNGLLPGLHRGAIVVDCSTSSADLAAEIDTRLKAHGGGAIDAPVSGLPVRAAAGTLAIMAGGRPPIFDQVKPLLDLLGTPVHVGAPGAGQITKAVSQLILGILLAALSEGFILGRKAGLDLEAMMRAIAAGLGGTEAMRVKGPNMIRGKFEPGFYLRYHLKDLNIAMDSAARLGLALPFTSLARELFRMGVNTGCGDADDSAVMKVLENLNKNAIAPAATGRRRSRKDV